MRINLQLFCVILLLSGFQLIPTNSIYGNNPDSLRAIYLKGDDSTKFDAIQKMVIFFRNVDVDSSKYYLKKLYSMSTDNNYYRLGQCQMIDGSIYHRQNLYDSADMLYNMALKTFKAAKYTKGVSSCLNNLGVLLQERGEYKKAGEYLFQHLRIADSLGDKKELSTAYVNIGLLLHEQEQYNEALEYYNTALALKKNINDKRGEALLYNNIGITHYFLDNFNNVLDNFKHALAIYRELNDLRGQAMSYFNIGEIYFEVKEDYEKALYYYKKSFDIEREIIDIMGQATSLNRMGACYSAMNNYRQAVIVQQKALQMLRKINTPKQISQVLSDLSLTFENLSDYKNALTYYKEYVVIHDSLVSKNNIQQTALLKEQYETDKKDQEISRLNTDKALQKLELETHLKDLRVQNVLLIVAAIFLIIITFAGYMILRLYRHSKHLNETLIVKNNIVEHKNNQLSVMYENVKKTSEIKEIFLSNITNDLKTPLNVISSFSSQLTSMQINDSHKYYSEQVKTSADNLQVLLNDLITHTKISSGILNIEELPFNIIDTIKFLKEIHEQKAIDKKIFLNIEYLSEGCKIIISDQIRIIQICSNLIFSALKNTSSGDTINCYFSIENNSLTITVKDNGVGIDKNVLTSSISESNISIQNKYSGINLAISIVKYLVELLGGTISLETHKNQGTIFNLNIPVEIKETNESTKISIHKSVIDTYLNVLIASENYQEITILMDIINAYDQNIIVDIGDGEKAEHLFLKNEYDLIFVDTEITTSSGISFPVFIKSMGKSKKIPQLIVGIVDEKTMTYGVLNKNRDFDDFIYKPFNPKILISLCEKVKTSTHSTKTIRNFKNNDLLQCEFLSDDPKKIQNTVYFFKNELRQQLFKLNIAIKEGSTQKMKSTISFIKSNLCYINDTELTKTMTFLEQAIVKNEKTKIETEFKRLETNCNNTEGWIKEYFNSNDYIN